MNADQGNQHFESSPLDLVPIKPMPIQPIAAKELLLALQLHHLSGTFWLHCMNCRLVIVTQLLLDDF